MREFGIMFENECNERHEKSGLIALEKQRQFDLKEMLYEESYLQPIDIYKNDSRYKKGL